METQNYRTRPSLLSRIRGGSHVTTPFDLEQAMQPPRVWANGAEMLADQFGI